MIKLKIRAEADTLEELSIVIEHLKKEYGMVALLDLPHGDEILDKVWIQNLEVENWKESK